MRYFAILARILALIRLAPAFALARTQSSNCHQMRRSLQDFAWGLKPVDGYPLIEFSNGTASSEVLMQYNAEGMDQPNFGTSKKLETTVYEADCLTISPVQAIVPKESANPLLGLYSVQLDVRENTVTSSEYYRQENVTFASLHFCVRVDYMLLYDSGGSGSASWTSVNFHETNITVFVDLTDGFRLAAAGTSRTVSDSSQSNSNLDYPVRAFYCNETNDEQPAPILRMGQIVQLCVSVDETVVKDQVYVSNIWQLDFDQVTSGVHSDPISDAIPDGLTAFSCLGGICNIKSQMIAKWFDSDPIRPGDLSIGGVALLALGIPPTAAPRQRIWRYRMLSFRLGSRFLPQSRQLEPWLNISASIQEKFSLQLSLQGEVPSPPNLPTPSAADNEDENENPPIALVIIGVIAALVGTILLLAALRRSRHSKRLEEKEVVEEENAFISDTENAADEHHDEEKGFDDAADQQFGKEEEARAEEGGAGVINDLGAEGADQIEEEGQNVVEEEGIINHLDLGSVEATEQFEQEYDFRREDPPGEVSAEKDNYDDEAGSHEIADKDEGDTNP